MSVSKGGIALLVLILVISLTLRLHTIWDRPFVLDEPHSVNFIDGSFDEMLVNVASDSRMPLYFILLWGVDAAFSPDLGLRLVSVLFGVLTVLGVFFLGRELFTEKVGLLAALLLTLSSFHIGYSQYVREYSLLTFLFVFSLLFFYRAITRGRMQDWILLGISNALVFLTHFLAGAFILSQFVLVLWMRKKTTVRNFLLQGVGMILVSVPWLLFLSSHAQLKDYGGVFDYNILGIPYVLYKLSIGVNLSGFLSWSPLLLAVMILFFSVLFLLTLRYFSLRQREKGTFLFSQLLLPLVILFAASAAVINVFSYRYLSPLLVVYVLIASAFLVAIKNRKWQILAITLFLTLSLTAVAYYFSVIVLPNWPVRFGI